VAEDVTGSIYLAGETFGDLGGTNAGMQDAFLGKFDPDGNPVWVRQFGTDGFESCASMTADSLGRVTVVGYTDGNLVGTSLGSLDGYIRQFDSAGQVRWTRQFGSMQADIPASIASDSLANLYVAGTTEGALQGAGLGAGDQFVSKFDPDGTLLWTRQTGTQKSDGFTSVAVDGLDHVYAVGISGTRNAPINQRFESSVFKYDSSGNLIWNRKIDLQEDVWAADLSPDVLGNVYVTGVVGGVPFDDAANVNRRVFVSKFDPTGTMLWTYTHESKPDAHGYTISIDTAGNIIVGGGSGAFDDNWVLSLREAVVPEPTSLLLLLAAAVGLASFRCKRR
jgi:hypothetical protein